jgi:hypothetical protein
VKVNRWVSLQNMEKCGKMWKIVKIHKIEKISMCIVVLPPENLRTYFELSVQAWTLYKAPQRYARYPNSCPEQIKL